MQQSNRGMVVVVSGGALLGLALALAYVFYWSPRLKADAAKEEVRQWGDHWMAARSCLLGTSPRSSDIKEALLVRELLESDLKGALHKCVEKLKSLKREDGASTENLAIEKAWYELQFPIGKLAQEHAWRTARTPNKSEKKLRLNLANAIATLDESYATLRRAAGLKFLPPPGPTLARASLYLPLRAPKSTDSRVTDLRLASEAITYTVQDSESLVRARVPGGTKTISFRALSPLALRAVNGDWGLWLEDDGIPLIDEYASEGATIVAGPLDQHGEPAGDGAILHTLAKDEKVQLRFATGAQNRTVLFRLLQVDDNGSFAWSYQLRASSDAGTSWTPHALPQGDLWPSLKETSESSYIVSTDPADPMTLKLMTISDAGIREQGVSFPGTLRPSDTWPPDQCVAPHRLWWVLAGTLYSMGPEGELVTVPGTLHYEPEHYAYQFLCGDSYAAVHARPYSDNERSLQYQACTLEGCDEVAKTSSHTGDAVVKHIFHKGGWLAIQELDGVVAIWRGGNSKEPEALYRLDLEGELSGVLSWGDAILFAVWPEGAAAPSLLQAQ